MANIQLAANLRYLRELNNRSQEDMGAIFNISRQAYSNYETMNRTPDLDMLIRIARYYDLTLDQLITHNLSNESEKEKVPHNMALNISNGNSIYLTDEELDMILGFRSLSQENQTLLTGFIHSHQ